MSSSADILRGRPGAARGGGGDSSPPSFTLQALEACARAKNSERRGRGGGPPLLYPAATPAAGTAHTPLLAALLGMHRRYLWAFVLVLSLSLMALYPTLIAPLFNKASAGGGGEHADGTRSAAGQG